MYNTKKSIEKIKYTVKQIYFNYIDCIMAERKKAMLRKKVMTLPITSDYPFDVEIKFLRFLNLKSAVMLDIGANIGTYSAILEDIVESDNLYIFEPLPYLNKHLKQYFKKAHVFNYALSDKEGTQNIRVPYIENKRFDSRASFNLHTEPNQTGFDEIKVPLISLDNIIKKIHIDSIGFIKIDVEGHEIEVLNGGIETITRFKPLLLIEIETRHHKIPITEIFSRLEKMNYKGYYINSEKLTLLKTTQFDSDRDQNMEEFKCRNFHHYLNNFFFVHEASENDFVTKALDFLELEKTCQFFIQK